MFHFFDSKSEVLETRNRWVKCEEWLRESKKLYFDLPDGIIIDGVDLHPVHQAHVDC